MPKRTRQNHTRLSSALQLCLLLPWLASGSSAIAATGTHLPESTLYPRLLRISHSPRGDNGSILLKTGNRLFRSTDDGRTFITYSQVPTRTDRSADEPDAMPSTATTVALTRDTERCCSTLFELPRPLGNLPAGTLLYAASFFSGPTPAIDLFRSDDGGRSWAFLATPLKAGDVHHGLWEPAFLIARDGSLVMFTSDEIDSRHSQKLVQQRSRDGVHWSLASSTVALANPRDRPGMAIVSELPGGTFLMTYELCGPTAHCQVFERTSPDGWNFGDPAQPGTRIVSTTGQTFAHAPTNTLDPVTGQVIVVGQVLLEAGGAISPHNGALLFIHGAQDVSGPWQTIPAPVQVPSAYDNYCPNYSSAVLPVSHGRALLEVASDYDAAHHCTSYFATLPLPITPAPR